MKSEKRRDKVAKFCMDAVGLCVVDFSYLRIGKSELILYFSAHTQIKNRLSVGPERKSILAMDLPAIQKLTERRQYHKSL